MRSAFLYVEKEIPTGLGLAVGMIVIVLRPSFLVYGFLH